METQKWNVLSPDGFPITPEPFASEQAARDFIPRWCSRYEEQGYYSAVGGRIPLDELPDELRIVACD
jgi:hypothetical protein